MANTNLDEYIKLKKQVETAQQKVSQAEGALGEIMKQLKKEFGCDTLKEAKRKLKQLKKQEADSKEKFEDAIVEYKEKWEGEE